MFFSISSFLLLSNLVSGQSTSNSEACISLQTTTICNEYRNYSVLAFEGVTNAAEFDSYVLSQSAFISSNCTNWSNPKNTTIRYSRTFVCGYAIYFSTLLAPAASRCNQESLTPPMPVCQASVRIALDDVESNLKAKCPTVKIFSQYSDFVSQITNSNCILGVGQDVPLRCGYANISDAAAFCKTDPTAICCTATKNILPASNQSSTSTATAVSSPTNNNNTTSEVSPTAVTADAANPSSGSTVSPLLIGAAALGLALVAVLASVLYFMTKKKTDDQMHPGDEVLDKVGNRKSLIGEENSETMECVFEYKANLFDELTLEVGDEVGVISKFDDGWALGHNLTSGKEGTFPLACLAPFGASSESRYRDSRFESQYSKRDSSIRYTVDSSAFSRPY